MFNSGSAVYLRCKISKGSFSEEYNVHTKLGDEEVYDGCSPLRYLEAAEFDKTEDTPDEEVKNRFDEEIKNNNGQMDGFIYVRLIKDGGVDCMRFPDGTIIPVTGKNFKAILNYFQAD